MSPVGGRSTSGNARAQNFALNMGVLRRDSLKWVEAIWCIICLISSSFQQVLYTFSLLSELWKIERSVRVPSQGQTGAITSSRECGPSEHPSHEGQWQWPQCDIETKSSGVV